ncbi:hypothetical protein H9P43_002118 [Blastocladiella emersonii ATCC 22665]|nr:hypothetical protein H9P43_002118 [Blastocladiella emersonii ATCC 22665]
MPTCICPPNPADGSPASPFFSRFFGECIYTPRQSLAMAAGLVSIALYGLALLPQFLTNYRRKTVAGLSWGMFAIWTVADLCNTAGAYLTDQFATQKSTGIFFIITEVAFLAQYVYYQHLYQGPHYDGHHQPIGGVESPAPALLAPPASPKPRVPHSRVASANSARDSPVPLASDETAPLLATATADAPATTSYLAATAHVAFVIAAAAALSSTSSAMPASPSPSSTTGVLAPTLLPPGLPYCNAPASLSPEAMAVGSVLAWASGMLYFCSRFPQIWLNYTRRSVEGVSLSLFSITLAANLLYGFAVLLRADEIAVDKFVSSTLPFLVGSLGTLASDLAIFAQAYIYRGRPHCEEVVEPVPDA